MTDDQLIAAAVVVADMFGPDAKLEIDDDGSAYITTPHAVIAGFFAFDRDSVSRLTLIP